MTDEDQILTTKYTDFNEENFKKLSEENEALKLLIIQQKKSTTSFVTGSNSTRAFPTRGPLSSNPEYLDTLETKVRVLEKQNYTLRQRVLLLRNQLAETQKRHTLYDDVKSRVNTGKPLKRSKKSSVSSERLTKSMTLRSRPKSAPSQTNEEVKLLESRLKKLEAQTDKQPENTTSDDKIEFHKVLSELELEKQKARQLQNQLDSLLSSRSSFPVSTISQADIYRLQEQLGILQEENKKLLITTLNQVPPDTQIVEKIVPKVEEKVVVQNVRNEENEKLVREIRELKTENEEIKKKFDDLAEKQRLFDDKMEETVKNSQQTTPRENRLIEHNKQLEKTITEKLTSLETNLSSIVSEIQQEQLQAQEKILKFEQNMVKNHKSPEKNRNKALENMERKLASHLEYVDQQHSIRLKELEKMKDEIRSTKVQKASKNKLDYVDSKRVKSGRHASEPSWGNESRKVEKDQGGYVLPLNKQTGITKKRQKNNLVDPITLKEIPINRYVSNQAQRQLPSDSELMFPDGESEEGSRFTEVTNPVDLDRNTMTILAEEDVISFRLISVSLDQRLHFHGVHSCYIDFTFLDQVQETMSKKLDPSMIFNSKHDFIVDGVSHKKNRARMLRKLAPYVYTKNQTETILQFSLVGETDNNVVELGRTEINLCDIIEKDDYRNTVFSLKGVSQNDTIGKLVVTTKARNALLSLHNELVRLKTQVAF